MEWSVGSFARNFSRASAQRLLGLLVQRPDLCDELELGQRAGPGGAEVELDRAVGAGDVCGAVAVLGEGERDSGDLPGYLADDLPELLDAEPADVLAADGGVLVGAASRVHDLTADLRDAILVQAADGELDAEPRVDACLVDHQVTQAERKPIDSLVRPD